MAQLPEGTAAAFNQWMQNYIDNPKEYELEWESIRAFLDTAGGEEPSYGQSCVVLLEHLLAAQEAAGIADPSGRQIAFTAYETTGWSLGSRIKLGVSLLLTPLTVILIGRSIRVTATAAARQHPLE
jgi:hypothetical protein